VSLVISRLDYVSATLAGLPACQVEDFIFIFKTIGLERCGASDLQIQEI